MDWHIILFFAAALLISGLDKVANHKYIKQYKMPDDRMGLHSSVVAIMANNTSGISIIIILFLTSKAGLIGGWFFALSGLTVYFIYELLYKSFFISKGKTELKNHSPGLKLSPRARRVYSVFTFIRHIEGVFIQPLLASLLFASIFDISKPILITALMFFSFVFAGLGGFGGLRKLSSILLAVLLLSGFVVPFAYYLTDGIATVYESYTIGVNQPNDITGRNLSMYFFLFLLVMFGRMQLDTYMLHAIQTTKNHFKTTVRGLAGIGFVAFVAAMSAITAYIFSQYPQLSFTDRLVRFFHHNVDWKSVLLISGWLGAFGLGIAVSIYTSAADFLRFLQRAGIQGEERAIRYTYGFAFLITIISMLNSLFGFAGIEIAAGCYGLFYLAVAIPAVTLLFGKHEKRWLMPVAVMAAFLAGVSTYLYTGYWLQSAGVTVGLSGFMMLVSVPFLLLSPKNS